MEKKTTTFENAHSAGTSSDFGQKPDAPMGPLLPIVGIALSVVAGLYIQKLLRDTVGDQIRTMVI